MQADVAHLREQLRSWSNGIAYEENFWAKWARTGGSRWPESFNARFDPNTPVRADIASLIVQSGKTSVRMLDVGAGPVTDIGYVLPGIDFRLTAVDPLSFVYAKILGEQKLKPPVSTGFGNAEDLSAFFAKDYFDMVSCSNALDHSIDPMRGIREMVHVAKIGGIVALSHSENEAVAENYAGFHQHNFTVRDGRFVIWNREGEIDVAETLGDAVEVRANLDVSPSGERVDRGVRVVIHKVASMPRRGARDQYRRRLACLLEAVVGMLADKPVGGDAVAK